MAITLAYLFLFLGSLRLFPVFIKLADKINTEVANMQQAARARATQAANTEKKKEAGKGASTPSLAAIMNINH